MQNWSFLEVQKTGEIQLKSFLLVAKYVICVIIWRLFLLSKIAVNLKFRNTEGCQLCVRVQVDEEFNVSQLCTCSPESQGKHK